MDTYIWQSTILCEIVILVGLIRNHYLIQLLPWFTASVIFSTLESIPLASIQHHGTALDYYYAYYAFDLLNVAIYVAAAHEAWRFRDFTVISISMVVYLIFKGASYALLITGHTQASIALHGDLRFANIACYVVWSAMIWRYDVLGTQSSEQQGIDQ